MGFSISLRSAFALAIALAMAAPTNSATASDTAWYKAEIDLLAKLKARLTGSSQHNQLVDHIASKLSSFGVKVQTDFIEFTYNDPQIAKPTLNLNGQNIELSSYVPYSGQNSTEAVGTLKAVNPPHWSDAKGAIAVVNVTNVALNFNQLSNVWPGSPSWPDSSTGIPAFTSALSINDLKVPAAAGVKGVVYIWNNISSPLADGQYVPNELPDQPIPAAFVQSKGAVTKVVTAVESGTQATLKLPLKLVPKTTSRTLWTMFEGTELKNETIILNTHTDGVNAAEENGHIALLSRARHLQANPPRRTTILLWTTGHLHYGALVPRPQVATNIWLAKHPDLWKGGPGQRKAVFGSAVEHLGAVRFIEDLAANTYTSANEPQPEYLFAGTKPLTQLMYKSWHGAQPGVTRVNNPSRGAIPQTGEGFAWFLVGVPEISMVTAPEYILQVLPGSFDERRLVDLSAMARQIDSFARIWDAVDGMSADEIGSYPTDGTFKAGSLVD